jgi:hypothetical protein
LVAAAALGCGVMSATAHVARSTPYDWFSEFIRPDSWDDLLAIGGKILPVALLTMPLVAALSLALILIRLTGPRPRFRRLARQPGLMALCASGVAMALIGLQLVVMVLQDFAFAGEGIGWEEIWAIPAWLIEEEKAAPLTSCGGIAVLVSWITLLAGRQWRAKPTWADRLGRALGFCWILAAFAVASSNVLIQTDHERYLRLHPESKMPDAANAMR